MARLKKLKDLLLLAIVGLAFAVSLNMFRRLFGITSPWFMLLVMFCFLGLGKFAGRLYLLRLPAFLRPLRPAELKGKRHLLFGVSRFGRLLRATPLRHLNTEVYMTNYPRDRFAVEKQLEATEAIHLYAALLVLPYMVYAFTRRWWGVVACFLLLQIVMNVYPILHLRLARGRLHRFRLKQSHRHPRRISLRA